MDDNAIMIDLPVISSEDLPNKGNVPPSRWKQWGLHVYRVAVLVLILWLIREHHLWTRAQLASNAKTALDVAQVKEFFPTATKLTHFNPTHGGQYVADEQGKLLGYVLQTSPQADRIIGYSGPTNLLIAIDSNNIVLGLKILSSADTPEHVQQIKDDPQFLNMFEGRTLDKVISQTEIDGVSGATLTSIAIAESIVFRLAGKRPSYKFPDPVTIKQVSTFFPKAAQLAPSTTQLGLLAVYDKSGNLLGQVMRTSPAADNDVGYQGSTELLVAFNKQGKVLGIHILKSYETKKYVVNVNKGRFFMERFNGLTLSKLSQLDVFEDEIEGVSGATDTSMSMARGMIVSAQEILKQKKPQERTLTIHNRDIGIGIIILIAILISLTRLRGNKWVRISFQILLLIYVGFINADFVSQALIVGWVKSGLPWKITPGLVLLVAASIALPVVSRNQLYCNHICPYGAAQQLLTRLPFCKYSFPKLLSRLLKFIPGLLLCAVILIAFLIPTFSFTTLEPFDAFLFKSAGVATLTIAIVGILIALFVPMAYCRYGCPTGAFLDFLRLHGQHDKFNKRDLFALLMLGIAMVVVLLQ